MRTKARRALAILAATLLLGAHAPEGGRTEVYVVALSGLAEASVVHPSGGNGDLDGSGQAKIVIDAARTRICYDFQVADVSSPLMAHIHRAPMLRNGPTVVTLFTEIDGDLEGCIAWTPKQLEAIVADPAGHYVNLYTTEFPDGAVRGQLR